MIRALIIDDEPAAQSGLESILKLFCPQVKVLGVGNGVADGLVKIRSLKPDLVFLDIELGDGKGFDILEQVEDVNFSVIFVTAFDHYAIKAFRLNAVDYLLKPVDPDELIAAVEKTGQTKKTDYTPLLREVRQADLSKIAVPGSKETIYIELGDIIRMESDNNYTYIHRLNQRPMLVSKTIKSFEGLLPETSFIRCHQRHIVNLNHVRSYVRNEAAHLVMMPDDEKIPISRANRSKVDQLLKWKFPSA